MKPILFNLNFTHMNKLLKFQLLIVCALLFALPSCVSKKKYDNLQNQLNLANNELGVVGKKINELTNRLNHCEQERSQMMLDINAGAKEISFKEREIELLKDQIAELNKLKDNQMEQIGDLTVLSKSASSNIDKTLSQMEHKDKYIALLQAAKNKSDSMNLALAVNLKGVLRDGIMDNDINISVDKTVVFVDLSDRMTFNSGSYNVTSKAKNVLGKIAQIIASRPDLEVSIEGYTDSNPIHNSCIQDNWDLSVKRATSVIRVLEKDYNVDPSRLVAAGRGQYHNVASNDTSAGRERNRRTRIILLPKIDQFYDLLDPEKALNK